MDTVGAIQELLIGVSDEDFDAAATVLSGTHLSVLVETFKAFDEWDIAALVRHLASGYTAAAVDADEDAPYDEHGYDEHDDSKDNKSLPPLDLSDIPF